MKSNSQARLTRFRALLLSIFFAYKEGNDSITLLTVQKLAYFFQRFQEPLKLRYEKGWYGPYSHDLNKVLEAINGKYIEYDSYSLLPHNEIKLNYDRKNEIDEFLSSLDESSKIPYFKLLDFIKGFETPFSMELLASLDWVLRDNPCMSAEDVYTNIMQWTKRKARLMQLHHIEVAHAHLLQYQDHFYSGN